MSGSSTSDSDEDSEARKDLLARMQQFRAKKNQRQAASVAADASPMCVQVGWPLDYVEYTGIWADCRRRGWEVIDMSRRCMPDPSTGPSTRRAASGDERERAPSERECDLVPDVQFVPYKKVSRAGLFVC